ncbi:MAG: universal stress protein [Ignavibacteriales bacterium]|nr:universal stress protein [Ignavibacteriales bacterium]
MKKKQALLKKKAIPQKKKVTPKKTAAARPAKLRPIDLKKILVPVDFSEHSKKALKYAIPFARQFSAALSVLYVVEPAIYPADLSFGQVGLPNLEAELRSKGEEDLAELVADTVPDDLEVVPVIRTGLPFVEIISFARDEDVDLIVVATHGHTGVEHILFGSTAEKIVRKAPCPVLVVRADERDFINERV